MLDPFKKWMCQKLTQEVQGKTLNQGPLKLRGEVLTLTEGNGQGQQVLSTGPSLGH